nr:reverse transcriptase domain-containing protein [Tanacetum cinerariifolium]
MPEDGRSVRTGHGREDHSPRMQAFKSKGTTSKDKEGSREQTDKTGEPDDIIQPSLISSRKYTPAGEKDKGEDESLEKLSGSRPPEKVVIHDGYPNQTITIGGSLTAEYRSRLIKMLRKDGDAFAWTPTDMIGIPRFVAEHEPQTYPHIEPRVQRKLSITLDKRKVVKDEVTEWLKAGIVRNVRYPTWMANPILVKNPDTRWRMCSNIKDLNKACPKDLYPLLEIDWKMNP